MKKLPDGLPYFVLLCKKPSKIHCQKSGKHLKKKEKLQRTNKKFQGKFPEKKNIKKNYCHFFVNDNWIGRKSGTKKTRNNNSQNRFKIFGFRIILLNSSDFVPISPKTQNV